MPDTTDQAPLATPFLTLAANLRARECSAVEKTLLEAVALVLIALAAMLDEFEAERLQATTTQATTIPAAAAKPGPSSAPRRPTARAAAQIRHTATLCPAQATPRPHTARPPSRAGPSSRAEKSAIPQKSRHALFVSLS